MDIKYGNKNLPNSTKQIVIMLKLSLLLKFYVFVNKKNLSNKKSKVNSSNPLIVSVI